MAAKYRKVDPRIWGDEGFSTLTVDQKLIAFYCLTGPQVNRIGIFKFSFALAAEYCGINPIPYAKGMARVCDTLFWQWDDVSKVVYFPKWWKYNLPDNPKAFQGALKDLHDVPKTHLLVSFASNKSYLPDEFHSLLDTYAIPYAIPYTIPEAVTVTVTEAVTETKTGTKSARAVPGFEISSGSILDTPEFQSAWKDWLAHRREIKHALTPTQASKQLAQFESWGIARSIAAIEFTITKGWQGIREPDSPLRQSPTPLDLSF